MRDLCVGLIGCGYWGSKLLAALASTPGVRIASVCDARAPLAMRAAHQYRVPVWHTDAEAVISSAGMELVVLATPAHTHYALGREVLAAARHLLVAKPASTTTAHVVELASLAQRHGVVLAVDHTYLYSAPIHHLRQLIQSGAIGAVRQIGSVRTNSGDFRSDVSIFWDLATHDVSIIDFLLSAERPERVVTFAPPPRPARAPTRPDRAPAPRRRCGRCSVRGAGEDLSGPADIFLEFPSRVRAAIHVDWHAAAKRRVLTISGTEGEITHDHADAPDTIHLRQREGRGCVIPVSARFLEERVGLLLVRDGGLPEPLRVEIAHLVRCIRRGAPPLADAASAIRVAETIEAAEHGALAAMPAGGPR